MLRFPEIINHCYVVLTEGCNLRCQYCYVKDRSVINELPYEFIEKIKNAFTCANKPTMIFFGGEPLLKIDLIKKIVENYSNDFRFQVVTNGTINLHRFIEEIYKPNKSNFDVQVSWDGNTYTRPNANGNVSNNNVYDNIITELNNGGVFEGRCVLNELSVKSFFNTYQTFKNLHSKYKFSGDFTIAHQPSFPKSFSEELKKELSLIYADIKNSLNSQSFFAPRLILRTILNVLQNRPVIACDIGTHVVIKPNGDIYPCTILSQQDERFKLGNINTYVDTEIIDDLRLGASCKKECEYKSICDGGCRYERIINFPNDWKCSVCNHTCDIYKVMFEETKTFLNNLSNDELNILNHLINEFNIWSIDYDFAINDNSKRLFYDRM